MLWTCRWAGAAHACLYSLGLIPASARDSGEPALRAMRKFQKRRPQCGQPVRQQHSAMDKRMQLPSVVSSSSGWHGSSSQSVIRSTTRDAEDPGSNPALGKQWSRDYPIDIPVTLALLDANLRYQEALDWRKWTKGGWTTGGCRFHLLSARF